LQAAESGCRAEFPISDAEPQPVISEMSHLTLRAGRSYEFALESPALTRN